MLHQLLGAPRLCAGIACRAFSAAASQQSYLPPARAKGLHKTIRDPRPAPAPKAVRMAEAEKLGVFDTAALASVAPRTVPASAKEFAINRSKYQKEVNALRLKFKQEWTERTEREVAAAAAERAAVEAQKRARAAAKVSVKLQRQAEHEKRVALEAERLRALQEVRRAKRAAYFNKVERKRQDWLAAMNADAKNWIAADEIDTKITAETFAATHPWQFDKYYSHQAARQAEMDGSTQFPEDWESDIDADAVDLWEPLDRKLATGVQLEEMYLQKRMPQIMEDLEAWRDDYMARNPDYFTPEVVEAIKAGKSVEDFAFDDASGQPLGVDASDAEEDGTEDLDELISETAAADDEGHKEDLELDSIFNMISKEASPEKK